MSDDDDSYTMIEQDLLEVIKAIRLMDESPEVEELYHYKQNESGANWSDGESVSGEELSDFMCSTDDDVSYYDEGDVEQDEQNPTEADLLRRHKVLLVRVNYDGNVPDEYFLDCVKLIRSKTANYRVFYNNADQHTSMLDRLKTKLVCNWIPNSMLGLFRNPFYWLRTLLTSLSSYYNSRQFVPTLIFVDAHPIAIPILKYLFKCPVASFAFFQDMLIRGKCAILPATQKYRQAIANHCLQRADELIVPSMAIGKKYLQRIDSNADLPLVFYPPLSGDNIRLFDGVLTPLPDVLGEGNSDKINILIIGPWEVKSNFHLVLTILEYFMTNFVDNKAHKARFEFTMIGYMMKDDRKAELYRASIYNMARMMPYDLREHLVIRTNPETAEIVRYYLHCIAVLNLTTEEEFSWSIIEAQYFGRPIVSVFSPFSEEIIEHGFNGYLMDLSPIKFAKYMYLIYSWIGQTFSLNCSINFVKKYSEEQRNEIIKKIMLKFVPLTDEETYA